LCSCKCDIIILSFLRVCWFYGQWGVKLWYNIFIIGYFHRGPWLSR
jgi:hypothetical protein